MTLYPRGIRVLTACMLCGGSIVALANAESLSSGPQMPSMTMSYQDDGDAPASSSAWENPFSFEIAYYLYSDYIFRGINFSEYDGEGSEDLNHQMTTALSVDIATVFGAEAGSYGAFNFGTFFEWYAGQEQIDPEKGGQSLQEIDYVLSWSYDIDAIATSLDTGVIFYVFPSATALNTEEWYISLSHNDAWMWKWLFPDNEDGILNPSLYYGHDIGQAAGGGWTEFGISHDFALPAHFTLSPSFTMAFDRNYIGRTLDIPETEGVGLAYLQYGLDLAYDVSGALEMPEEYGSITLGGFLYYNHVGDDYGEGNGVDDVLFGGFSLAWGF